LSTSLQIQAIQRRESKEFSWLGSTDTDAFKILVDENKYKEESKLAEIK